jgi:REP element-mobilizing transposase RayT
VPNRPRDRDAGLFHVFTRCVYASPALYRDDVDRLEFIRFLARTTAKSGWACIGFCLMTTHYHLVVEVEATSFRQRCIG